MHDLFITELVVIHFDMGSTTHSRRHLKFCYFDSNEVCTCSAKHEYHRYAFIIFTNTVKNWK